MSRRWALLAAAALAIGGGLAPPALAQGGVIVDAGTAGCPERKVTGLTVKSAQLYDDHGAPDAQISDKDVATPLIILKCVKSNVFMVDYKGRKLFVFRHQVVADTRFDIPCDGPSGRGENLQTAGGPAIVDSKHCKDAAKR